MTSFAVAPIVTLTTDFGTSDSYVGTMKGVILRLNPHASIVDITHGVPPQDVHSGAFQFDSASPYFPPGTIHVVVVDPGVGTERKPILVVGPDAYFICPDNGLLSYCFIRAGFPLPRSEPFGTGPVSLPKGWRAYHLNNPQFWNNPVSSTFHGRDLFAPVAGYLSRGVPPERMGVPLGEVAAFSVPMPLEQGGQLLGSVLSVDRFGNLVTNIPAGSLASRGAPITIDVGGHQLRGLANSYQAGAPLLAIIGSHGYLEISAANGNAGALLGLGVGANVRVAPA